MHRVDRCALDRYATFGSEPKEVIGWWLCMGTTLSERRPHATATAAIAD
jgi:hypothetical protein